MKFLSLLPLLTVPLLFLTGLLLGFVQSLGPDLDFSAYQQVLSGQGFWRSLVYSLQVAFCSTLLAAGLGLWAAHRLRSPQRKLALPLLQLTLPVPHLVVATFTVLWWSQGGLISRALHQMGVLEGPQDFPPLLYSPSGLGIVLSLLWKEIPFVALSVLAASRGLEGQLEETAKVLGAGSREVFWQVWFPQVLPALLSACVLVFSYSLSAYEVPALLGPTSPNTLSVLAYQTFTETDLSSRPQALAMGFLLSLLGFLLVWLQVRCSRRTH